MCGYCGFFFLRSDFIYSLVLYLSRITEEFWQTKLNSCCKRKWYLFSWIFVSQLHFKNVKCLYENVFMTNCKECKIRLKLLKQNSPNSINVRWGGIAGSKENLQCQYTSYKFYSIYPPQWGVPTTHSAVFCTRKRNDIKEIIQCFTH